MNQERFDQAEKIFSLIRTRYEPNYLYHFLLGKLAFEKRDFDLALEHFGLSKELNPLYQPTSIFLSKTCLQQKDREGMLSNLVDAFLLSKRNRKKSLDDFFVHMGSSEAFDSQAQKKKIEMIFEARKDFFQRLIQQNVSQYLVEGTETVEIEIDDDQESFEEETFAPEEDAEIAQAQASEATTETESTPPLNVVPSLDQHELNHAEPATSPASLDLLGNHFAFKSLEKKTLESVAQFTSVLNVESGKYIYEANEPIYGIYFLSQGKVSIERNAGKHTLQYRLIDQEALFGEIYFFLGEKQIQNAKALSDSTIIFFNKSALKNIFARNQELSNHFLWHIWKSLNAQLHQYLEGLQNTENPDHTFSDVENIGDLRTQLESSTKIKISGHIEDYIQTLGEPLELNRGDMIFDEHQDLEHVFFVLEGEISLEHKGELTSIVRPQEWFGELTLCQQHHPSHLKAIVSSDQAQVIKIQKADMINKVDQKSPKTAALMLTVCKIIATKIQILHSSLDTES
ncbi:MAG: cyclic nucleotide-binding domain-containing protein [Bdellovibrionota bacterium]